MYYSFLEGLLAETLITDNSKTESVSKLKFGIYSFGMMVYPMNHHLVHSYRQRLLSHSTMTPSYDTPLAFGQTNMDYRINRLP